MITITQSTVTYQVIREYPSRPQSHELISSSEDVCIYQAKQAIGIQSDSYQKNGMSTVPNHLAVKLMMRTLPLEDRTPSS